MEKLSKKITLQRTAAVLLLVVFGVAMFWAGAKWQAPQKIVVENLNSQPEQAPSPRVPSERIERLAGEIVAKDDISFMLKQKDGSLKKIIFTKNTPVRKTKLLNSADLNTGDAISVSGKSNSKGTFDAQIIVSTQN